MRHSWCRDGKHSSLSFYTYSYRGITPAPNDICLLVPSSRQTNRTFPSLKTFDNLLHTYAAHHSNLIMPRSFFPTRSSHDRFGASEISLTTSSK